MKTKLSVNINKIATLRNARGGNFPSVLEAAVNCQKFGADGITVHPRPDERHITYQDVEELKDLIQTEFNIEGNPAYRPFMDLVLKVKPHQVTLVPDQVNSITSNAGWDTEEHFDFLSEVIAEFKAQGIRTSIFLDPNPAMVESAAKTGVDRIELYTEMYAQNYTLSNTNAINPYLETAIKASELGLGINAGHDLNLQNIEFFAREIPKLSEVSIGHALICEALYLGLEKTIQSYQEKLKNASL
ncbi:MAG: pyridoxine 5'-phosphate synthase [Flavobacteriaceae bacterium]|nr:MAG: pyridoxine 5'-phosphate synthase [Flavobacteriaceae bacterium]